MGIERVSRISENVRVLLDNNKTVKGMGVRCARRDSEGGLFLFEPLVSEPNIASRKSVEVK